MSNMSANTSPQAQSSGRRVNNLPVYIGVGALAVFLVIIALVAMDRAKHGSKSKIADEKPSNANFASAVIADHNEGFIPPAQQAGTSEDTKSKDKELAVPVVMPQDLKKPPPPPDRNNNGQHATGSDEADNIRRAKLQEFENAVKAKTSVQVADLRGKQATGTDPILDGQDELGQRIRELRKHIDGLQDQTGGGAGDPKVQVLGDKATLRNDYKQFTGKGDRWRLDSKPEPPRTKYELRAGFVVPATMISGINSDLPGQVIGQVSENVYDTPTGRYLLIPQGSRLVGSYSSDVAYGQHRVLVAWQRIVFPDGKAMDLGAMPGADSAGYAGFSDKINNYYFRTFASAILMSGIIAGASLSQPNSNTGYVNGAPSASQVLSESLGQALGTTMAQMIAKNLNVSPTLEIRPGYRFNVMVVKDLTFERPYRSFDYATRGGLK